MKTLFLEITIIIFLGILCLIISYGIYVLSITKTTLTSSEINSEINSEIISEINSETNSEINSEIPFVFPTSNPTQDFTFVTDYASEEFADITDDNSIFTDPMFSDIIKYMSTISDKNIVTESGVEKCLKNCEGNCMEYGFTGVGICFPRSWQPPTQEEMTDYAMTN